MGVSLMLNCVVSSRRREGRGFVIVLALEQSISRKATQCNGSDPRTFSALNVFDHVFWVNSSATVTTFHKLSRSITESVGLVRWDDLGRENLCGWGKVGGVSTDVLATSAYELGVQPDVIGQ